MSYCCEKDELNSRRKDGTRNIWFDMRFDFRYDSMRIAH